MLIFRQLFDPQSGSYSYLLADPARAEAILIDPVFEQARRDMALIRELDLTLLATVETHVHADHVTGAGFLRRRLKSKVAVPAGSGVEGADLYLSQGDQIKFGSRFLETRATPGHTRACKTYVLDNETMGFTGDCLLIRGSGRTDFQGGDARTLYRSVRTQIFTLPDSCLLYPAHDYRGLTVTSVAEEARYNPRLGGALSENDFAGFMANLKLGHPKKLDIAVPANLRCGEFPEEQSMPDAAKDPDWAPLSLTFGGVWEVQPHWLDENPASIQVLDVREPDEFHGPMGHISGAKLIPLGDLAERISQLDRSRPIVAVCRAGGRSAQATFILREAGFERVANLSGGMLRWRGEGHPVEGGAS
jgi:sulfur dioxygenase